MEEKTKHFERPTTNRPPSLFNLTFWAVFVGLIAGFGGYLVANYFLPANSVNYFNSSNTPTDIKINLEQPLTNFAKKQSANVAGVYKAVQPIAAVGEPVFSQADFLGSAIVVTSDGWLMTTNQVVKNSQAKVVLGDRIYDIVDLKEDKFSGVVFIKIDGNLLSPVNFQFTDDAKVGETLFSNIDIPTSIDHAFYVSTLSSNHFILNKYLSTDSIDYYLKIADSKASMGAPYFNMNGELLGLVYKIGEDSLLIPAEYLKQAIKNLLNGTERVIAGISYLDMENNSGFNRKGVLIYNPGQTALTYNLPGQKAGLKVNDQLVAVNNDIITSTRSLTSILQNYRPGDQVIIKVLRDNQEIDINLSL
ncbi:S1C family serine protease [Patescibacteria group bacterium]|nr:S1C family serine protease [Patescibacteria group bacterium]